MNRIILLFWSILFALPVCAAAEKKTEKCPLCSQNTIVRIVYGLPGEEMMEQARRGEIVLGGCVISGNDPDSECVFCRTNFLPLLYKLSDVAREFLLQQNPKEEVDGKLRFDPLVSDGVRRMPKLGYKGEKDFVLYFGESGICKDMPEGSIFCEIPLTSCKNAFPAETGRRLEQINPPVSLYFMSVHGDVYQTLYDRIENLLCPPKEYEKWNFRLLYDSGLKDNLAGLEEVNRVSSVPEKYSWYFDYVKKHYEWRIIGQLGNIIRENVSRGPSTLNKDPSHMRWDFKCKEADFIFTYADAKWRTTYWEECKLSSGYSFYAFFRTAENQEAQKDCWQKIKDALQKSVSGDSQ